LAASLKAVLLYGDEFVFAFHPLVILNLFQAPLSIEKDTARIFSVKCVAAGIPDQVRNDDAGISEMTR
jgi:hypothetical protein